MQKAPTFPFLLLFAFFAASAQIKRPPVCCQAKLVKSDFAKALFQLKPNNVVRIITGWDI